MLIKYEKEIDNYDIYLSHRLFFFRNLYNPYIEGRWFILIDVKRLRNQIEEVPGLLDMYNDESYKDWLENHSERAIRRWLIDNDYNTYSCVTIEYILYIAKHYLDWSSNNE